MNEFDSKLDLRPSLIGTLLAAVLLVGAAIILATMAASHA